MDEENNRVRIAAIGDVHCNRNSKGRLKPLFNQMRQDCDVMLLCGDLTDYGLVEETKILVGELEEALSGPVLAVLGNHDYESGHPDEVRRLLYESGVQVLDGESCEILGIGFAGAKGFGGGFLGRALEPWGESSIKAFVQEAMSQALRLEAALARLTTIHKVALLHYAPIRDTVVGEPLEIYPFLGSCRLEEPLDRYGVSAVFHGHAHSGSPEGRTSGGTPVYNVAMPLLKKCDPQRAPYRVLTLGPLATSQRPAREDFALV